MTSILPKLSILLALLLGGAALAFALLGGRRDAGGGAGVAGTGPVEEETRLGAGPRYETPEEIPEPPPEARLSIELEVERVGELDRSAEELPFWDRFGCAVEGRVVDEIGGGVEGALVEVLDGPSAGRVASTKLLGRFELGGLAPGAARVRFSTVGTVPATRWVALQEEEAAVVEVALRPGVPFFGRVRDYEGKGVAEAWIEIEDRRAPTKTGGFFTFDEVPAGDDVVAYVGGPGFATQRLRIVVPREAPLEGYEGLQVTLLRGVSLSVLPQGFPLSAPLRVSVLPREGHAGASFPQERFLGMAAPVDGSPLEVEGLPTSFLGEVRVSHPFAAAVREVFPLVIGQTPPMPLTVVADPGRGHRVSGVVRAAPSGLAAGVADALVRIEPAELDAYLSAFQQRSDAAFATPWLGAISVETVTNDAGRFSIDLSFPPPWRAVVRRAGFRTRTAALAEGEENVVRLEPYASEPVPLHLVVSPARGFDVRLRLPGAEETQELAGERGAVLELGSLPPGVYRVRRRLQGVELAPQEVVASGEGAVVLEMGWGRS